MKQLGLALLAFLFTITSFLGSMHYARFSFTKSLVVSGVTLVISIGIVFVINQKLEQADKARQELRMVRETLKGFSARVEKLMERVNTLKNKEVKDQILKIGKAMKDMADSDIEFLPPMADIHFQFCETFLYEMKHKPDKEKLNKIQLAASRTYEETSKYYGELGSIKPRAMLSPGDSQIHESERPQMSLDDVGELLGI